MIALGFYEGVSTLSKIIRWETRSYISHVSILQVPDSVVDEYGSTRLYRLQDALAVCPVWEAWGSLKRPVKGSGVFRRTGIDEGHTPGTKLHIYRLDPMIADKLYEQAVVSFLDDIVDRGTKYDWWGLVRFMARINRQNENRAFCSELAHIAMLRGGVPLLHRIDPNHVAPADLYRSPLLTLLISTRTGEATERARTRQALRAGQHPQKGAGQTCRALQSQIQACPFGHTMADAAMLRNAAIALTKSGTNPTDNSNSNLTPALAHGTMAAC